jgi:hypothetical protein
MSKRGHYPANILRLGDDRDKYQQILPITPSAQPRISKPHQSDQPKSALPGSEIDDNPTAQTKNQIQTARVR